MRFHTTGCKPKMRHFCLKGSSWWRKHQDQKKQGSSCSYILLKPFALKSLFHHSLTWWKDDNAHLHPLHHPQSWAQPSAVLAIVPKAATTEDSTWRTKGSPFPTAIGILMRCFLLKHWGDVQTHMVLISPNISVINMSSFSGISCPNSLRFDILEIWTPWFSKGNVKKPEGQQCLSPKESFWEKFLVSIF